jgi:hypothetical protein
VQHDRPTHTHTTHGVSPKASFLDKTVRLVSIVKGAALPVQVSQMLAGKQPLNTVRFLMVRRCGALLGSL